ncbi:MAG TPA: biotin--[acetyl-CoA-carboxylase] ligase [Terracidiphilus sp.]|jgi:BirA family biotin operon repressor/biotin-[acetyl-CoA-carboxylase] ligase|nr:biotin--[acetyl-CoA-carboxylase] ligase [Terracidiphilus sp.]
MYDFAALEAALAGTAFAGKLHFSSVTRSTNTDALEAARVGAPHGSVYFADEQSAGRGRGDHKWESHAGQGLYVSVVLRLPLAAERVHLLPLAAGLAAIEAIHAASEVRADLRWPNDLLLGARKAGGILVESKLEGNALAYAVAGIGINVHQQSFDPELATAATSLDLAAGRAVDRQELLVCLLKSLERETRALLDERAAAAIPVRVEAASTWVRGRRVEVHGPQACVGVTAGLDADGFLRVETASEIVTVRTGGIRAAKAG